jgi:putative thioredoxin
VKAFIDRLLGEEGADDVAVALEAAEQAFAANDLQGAAEIYASVLQGDRQNPAALAGLARCYLKSGDIARAEQTIELVPPDKREAAPVTGVRAAIELAKKAGKSGDTRALEAKLAANAADHQARLDLALALAARGDKVAALDHLLELFRRDRNWNDQAARKQLVKLFDAWGPKDPNTIEGRKRLSSLMFS